MPDAGNHEHLAARVENPSTHEHRQTRGQRITRGRPIQSEQGAAIEHQRWGCGERQRAQELRHTVSTALDATGELTLDGPVPSEIVRGGACPSELIASSPWI